jgi:hypothetical protein
MKGYGYELLMIVLSAFLSGGLRAQAVTEQGKVVSVTVDDARPVGQAVDLLMEKYGYRITYEDPPYVYQGDLKDRVVKGFKDQVPAGGALKVTFTPASGMGTSADMAGLLERVLQAQAVADKGGHFRLVQDDQVFHVVPFEVKDRRGHWVSHTSILDAAISLPGKERAGGVMLEDICAAVGVVTHAKVMVGAIPANVIIPYRGTLSAENESARKVLLRALDGTNRKLTWIMNYDPSGRIYFLNVLLVRVP